MKTSTNYRHHNKRCEIPVDAAGRSGVPVVFWSELEPQPIATPNGQHSRLYPQMYFFTSKDGLIIYMCGHRSIFRVL